MIYRASLFGLSCLFFIHSKLLRMYTYDLSLFYAGVLTIFILDSWYIRDSSDILCTFSSEYLMLLVYNIFSCRY